MKIIIGKKVICTSFIQLFHLTAFFHILAQCIYNFLMIPANGAKSHGLINQTAALILSRKLSGMVVYQRFPLISKVKLHAGIVGNHQAAFGEDFFIAHVTGSLHDFHIVIFIKIVLLCAHGRVQQINQPITGLFGALYQLFVINQRIIHPKICAFPKGIIVGLFLVGNSLIDKASPPGGGNQNLVLVIIVQAVKPGQTGNPQLLVRKAIEGLADILILINRSQAIKGSVIKNPVLILGNLLDGKPVLDADDFWVPQIPYKRQVPALEST